MMGIAPDPRMCGHEAYTRQRVLLRSRSRSTSKNQLSGESPVIFDHMVTIIKKNTPKARLRAAVKRAKPVPQKGFDARKHLGKWKLDEDALTTQKTLRDEWG